MGYFPQGIMGDKTLLQGTLDMLILKALTRGAMHGYGIVEFIQQSSDDILRVEEGALYPALHRLEQRGWLEAQWGYTEKGRRAKYYQLTAGGRRQLAAELHKWSRYSEAVRLVLTADGAR